MSASAPGTTVVTVPGPDGATIVATLNHDSDTGELQSLAVTVDGGTANIQVHTTTRPDPVLFTCIPGAHITAAMLADIGIWAVADIHALTVTAA